MVVRVSGWKQLTLINLRVSDIDWADTAQITSSEDHRARLRKWTEAQEGLIIREPPNSGFRKVLVADAEGITDPGGT